MADKKTETNVQPTTATQKDIDDNKVMAILSYIWILVLIPLLAVKDSPFTKYHVKQGLVLLISMLALGLGLGIIMGILGFIPIINIFAGIASVILFFVILPIANLIFMIIGIINASKGEMKELPLIGKFADKLNF